MGIAFGHVPSVAVRPVTAAAIDSKSRNAATRRPRETGCA
jgi:hypothetical protein